MEKSNFARVKIAGRLSYADSNEINVRYSHTMVGGVYCAEYCSHHQQ